jgi:hypothetical protein
MNNDDIYNGLSVFLLLHGLVRKKGVPGGGSDDRGQTVRQQVLPFTAEAHKLSLTVHDYVLCFLKT